MQFTVKYMYHRSKEVKIMNNKKPKLSKYNIATAKRLLKYVTETYKARFILVFVCIFLSAVASISVSLSLKYMLDDFILPLIGQKVRTIPNFTVHLLYLAVFSLSVLLQHLSIPV